MGGNDAVHLEHAGNQAWGGSGVEDLGGQAADVGGWPRNRRTFVCQSHPCRFALQRYHRQRGFSEQYLPPPITAPLQRRTLCCCLQGCLPAWWCGAAGRAVEQRNQVRPHPVQSLEADLVTGAGDCPWRVEDSCPRFAGAQKRLERFSDAVKERAAESFVMSEDAVLSLKAVQVCFV